MRFASLAAVALILSAAPARGSTIGVFFAPDGSDPDVNVTPFVPFFTYILAVLGGDAAAAGITGAEFRCDGFDPAWFNTVTPNPSSNLSIGNPIAGGANIAFPSCQSAGLNGTVHLYVIQSVALAPVTPRFVSIRPHGVPTNSNYPCALVTLCDTPVFTKLCVFGGTGCINRDCGFAVRQTSWTEVKSLYE